MYIIFYQCYCKLKYVCPDKNNRSVKKKKKSIKWEFTVYFGDIYYLLICMSNGPLSHFDKLVGILKQEVLFMCRAIIYMLIPPVLPYIYLFIFMIIQFSIFLWSLLHKFKKITKLKSCLLTPFMQIMWHMKSNVYFFPRMM